LQPGDAFPSQIDMHCSPLAPLAARRIGGYL
jgi:hypothetical protein